MKKTILGHVDCPLCDKIAQVKEDKNGNAYLFCPDCTAQVLTHGGEKDKLLRARMRPVTDTVPLPTVTDTVPLPLPTVPTVTDTVPLPIPEKPKKAGWLTPLVGADK
ncbi:MAG: hypothetical protein V4563_15120 [Pseudomonadota bacterium]